MLQFTSYGQASGTYSARFEANLVEEPPLLARPPGAGIHGMGNGQSHQLPQRWD